MNPESNQPEPELRKAPQPSPIPETGEPHRAQAYSTPRRDTGSTPDAADSRRAQAYTTPPRPDQQGEIKRTPKPKKWLLPVIAALVIAGGFAGVTIANHSGGGATPAPFASVHSQNVLTVTGADVDQAATDQAIAELKGGTPTPELAALPDSVKHEILSGDRKFYRLPQQTAPGQAAFQSGDRISIDINSAPYGTYDLSQPISISVPLKLGDKVGVHCLSVAQGKMSLVVNLATVLNPVSSHPLMKGQSQVFTVRQGGGGQNYDWFEQQAESGNVVAEYGLGHMYEYGLGVAQDRGQAVHWYQQAAAQNYLDAEAQLQLLQSNQ